MVVEDLKNEIFSDQEPILKTYHQDGKISYQEWKLDSKHHRLDGPAFILYYPSGEIKNEVWMKDGLRHRIDGPSRFEYYQDGKIKQIEWFVDGLRHRVGGPSFTYWLPDGSVGQEFWTENGKLHRVSLPAVSSFSIRDAIHRFQYFNRDREITKEVMSYLEENDLHDPSNIPQEHQIIMKMKFW